MAAVIRALTGAETEQHLDDLAEVLADCVAGGAGVGFLQPFSVAEARGWWQGVLPGVARGERVVIGALDGERLVGTVSLVLATPLNQQHRADIAKMLVHSSARKRGIGAALLAEAERMARRNNRSLLTLDTVTGSAAERLYSHLGWQTAGNIPNYALSPRRTFDSTTIMWKAL